MAHKKERNYFDIFVEMVDYSCQSAEILNKTLHNFNKRDLEKKMQEIHHIEHSADDVKHEMMSQLIRDFITPIEREDIMTLAHNIDDVTDYIEEVLMKMYMFNIAAVRPEALEFSGLVVNCCKVMKNAVEDFRHFKKSPTIHKHIVEINRLEELGDNLYTETIRNLYLTSDNAIEINAWTRTFECFEKCCDACEHVADVIEMVVMKNT